MRPLRSCCIRTDLALAAFDSVVEERARYTVVRTPSNPSFWWGNFLLYQDAPAEGAVLSWLEDHARELPGSPHVLFTWDRPDGAEGVIRPFIERGFEIDVGSILTARRVHRSPRHNEEVKVEPLKNDRAWEEAARVLTHAFAPRRSGTLEDLAEFVRRQLERYRAIQRAGMGQWFGAYLEGEMAGCLGLVGVEELGRFQLVGTDPRFARQGVCSTLVHDVARWGLEERRYQTLVIAADALYHAAKVYASMGFEETERLVSLIKKPPPA